MESHSVAVEGRHAAGIPHVGLCEEGCHGDSLILDFVLPDGAAELRGSGVGATGSDIPKHLTAAEAAATFDHIPVG